ncbi:glycoside hydrolase family 128 protein [Xylariomycetidae sp. FL2044]|nr:glycoside hydrolase family 128 protein [Xylariomycetidae sp. FL2044]
MSISRATNFIACLAACIALASPAQALPLGSSSRSHMAERGTSGGKQIALWAEELTTAAKGNNAVASSVKSAAKSLGNSGRFKWVANWNTYRPTEFPDSVAFAPQVKGPEWLTGDKWNNLESSIAQGKNVVVQFYNEPDQWNWDYAAAAKAWKEQMVPLRTKHSGLKLAGPATTSDQGKGNTWLDNFMGELAQDELPDYLALHYYTDANNSADKEVELTKTYLNERHGKHDLPIWLNEISCTSRDAAVAKSYLEKIQTELEKDDRVVAYGFHGLTLGPVDTFVSPVAQLMDVTGKVTDLAKDILGL